jgi:DNA-binding XRE family transcriptional regulator
VEPLKRCSIVLPWRPQRARRHMTGHRVLSDRRASGIPQAELANRLGVPSRKLSRIERGLDPIPASLIPTVVTMLRARAERSGKPKHSADGE